MKEFISEENKKTKEGLLWRSLSVLESANCHTLVLKGKSYLNFSSNDYLGYSHHPEVIAAGQKALAKYGAGGRSSRLISGTLDLHAELEQNLAAFKKTESCLLFPTGFMANLSVLAALLQKGDAVIMDRLNHASLIDAAKLSQCRIFIYDHVSTASLEKVLVRTKSYAKRLVVTDSLFSMDGDFAPLKEIADLCRQHQVWLMIDDAHATGVAGQQGIGAAELFGVLGQIEIVVGTLSKALGSQGGFVCGSAEFIDFLKNRARPFIYTTALSPASCAAANSALKLVGKEPEKRTRLLKMAEWFANQLKQGFPEAARSVSLPASPIVPFRVGPNEKVLNIAQSLKECGIFAPAIRPPTVPKDESRLRFSLTAEHTQSDLEKLLNSLKLCLKQS